MKAIKPSTNAARWPRNKVKSIECRKRDLIVRITDWTKDKDEPAERRKRKNSLNKKELNILKCVFGSNVPIFHWRDRTSPAYEIIAFKETIIFLRGGGAIQSEEAALGDFIMGVNMENWSKGG